MKTNAHIILLSVSALTSLFGGCGQANAQAPASTAQRTPAAKQAGVKTADQHPAKDTINGGIAFPPEKRMYSRITGRVKVVNAYTLRFEDETEACLSGAIDAPELEQKALIGETFYPCGKEAAEFLKKLIGDQPVTFLANPEGGERVGKNLAGACFVGETNLEIEMVRNGWAFSHHRGMDGWEILARENKRGHWSGKFILPERWRKGERLPGE